MRIKERPRRLRKSQAVRDAVSETILRPENLVWPVFIKDGEGVPESLSTLPGCSRHTIASALKEMERLHALGLNHVALFPCINDHLKNSKASEALNPNGLIPRAVRKIKSLLPAVSVITDVALDPYSSDGHDGIVKNGIVLNDETVVILKEQACVHAESGADFVGPSDMMDGRVGWIRQALDEAGYAQTGIISYTAKYASAFYGPFREALQSAPRSGDKKTYQMDPANIREALREARLDRAEGADILMVKPALSYLDVISRISRQTDLPVAAYNVSGEYAMVKFGAQNGAFDEKLMVSEILTSIRRAGASLIFTYHTPDILKWLRA